jgi:hypothetical protein
MIPRRLSRDLRLLRAWAAVSALPVVVLTATAFRQASAPARNRGEISVERINVVDADGTLRLVIADKDRMHPGVMDGKVIDRPRPVAGLIFFNDEGDEVGGLTYTGQEKGGERRADAGIMFDQLKQDQTIGLSYTEKNGERRAGFEVWTACSPAGCFAERVDLLLQLRNAPELNVQIVPVFRELGFHFIDQRAQTQIRAPEPGDFGVRRTERCRQRNG